MGEHAVEVVEVAVFVDWQNTYKTAREAFGWKDYPNEYGNYSPYQLARILAAGNDRGLSGELVRLNIHRGLPSQKHDSAGYAANRRQSAAWMAENPEVVIPRLRPLRYSRDPGDPPREKGVDVELALAAAEWTLTGTRRVAIIFSHDTDLVPVVEMVERRKDRGPSRRPPGRPSRSTRGFARSFRSTITRSRERCSTSSRRASTTRTGDAFVQIAEPAIDVSHLDLDTGPG